MTPNPTTAGYCDHGYKHCIEGSDGILRHDAAADFYLAHQVRPILAYSRTTGEPVALVPSASIEGKFHVTTTDNRCDCAGFGFRGRCSHLLVEPGPRPTRDPGAMFLRSLS